MDRVVTTSGNQAVSSRTWPVLIAKTSVKTTASEIRGQKFVFPVKWEPYSIRMKTGSVIVAVAMAMMVMNGSLLRGAEAQTPTVSCLSWPGAGVSFSEASTAVDQMLLMPGQCCQSKNGGFCTTVLITSGCAAVTICGDYNYCPDCADVGLGLDEVLAQCNKLNQVQGLYSPGGTAVTLYFLTSSTELPSQLL